MNQKNILIVDDNEENIYLLRALLQGDGYRVVASANGVEALDKARAHPPDLIISDILMPVMDGFSLCREWKKDGRLRRIPFIFYTATYTDERDRKFALDLGAEQFIVKPEEPTAFIQVIRETLLRVGNQPEGGALAGMKEEEEAVFLKEYNGALIRKLESKMAELERTHRDLVREFAQHKKAEEEKESLQAQLFQAQKLESMGRLAGGVAHDFNNKLTVILSYADMALQKVDPSQPLHSDLREITEAARRSAELTKQLLAFARQPGLPSKVLELNDTVASMIQFLRRLIRESVELDWRPGKRLGPVKIDPTQVDQVLTNLCVNAQDAIEGAGKIIIQTENASFDAAYCALHPEVIPGEYVRLSVKDNGSGIDKNVLGMIFEPFYTTKGVGKGTGLGLSTVYGIVRQNKGFIHVESEPGQGADFQVYLPRHQGQADKPRKEASPAPRAKGHETLMLVEDEPAILHILTLILKDQGYAVVAASKPSEALRLAQEHPGAIDLLLTDVVMPEMNGLELTRKLRLRYPALKRILMSGYGADAIGDQQITDEDALFIQKPFSTEDLSKIIRDALGG